MNVLDNILLKDLLKENNLIKLNLKNSFNIFESISFCLYDITSKSQEIEKNIK